jgi:hypothetical protein
MAQAPGHRLGQIIGDTLELAIGPCLADFADKHGLYLDARGPRPARRGKKVAWRDDLGNEHDLDHVLERGGSAEELGIPAAFIETAWRRYTKHNRNKAQEIQGAILPLLATWAHVRPFAGVVLAGQWTKGSLNQLRSNDFSILHISYETIIEVFKTQDIDVYYEESTSDDYLRQQIDKWEALGDADRAAIGAALRAGIDRDLSTFIDSLALTILRRIDSVSILPLYGAATQCETIEEGVEFIGAHDSPQGGGPFVRFEVTIRYDNQDCITADFSSSADVVSFLNSFS